jgi:hypothetical protein
MYYISVGIHSNSSTYVYICAILSLPDLQNRVMGYCLDLQFAIIYKLELKVGRVIASFAFPFPHQQFSSM